MTGALELLGADTNSPEFKGAKLATEIAGTAGAGGAAANLLARIPGAATAMPGVINALRTGGMTTGQTVAPGVLPFVRDLAVRSGAGAAVGGASAGLVDPEQAGTGALAGGALPVVTKVLGATGRGIGNTVRALAEPLNAQGKQKILGRALATAAGSEADDVAARLREAAAPFVGPSLPGKSRTVMGELVPGSMPTVAQAAGSPGLAALEQAAVATNPAVKNVLADRIKAQNVARVGVLDDMAGADGAREFAAASRDATAEQLYGAARRNGIDPAKLTPDALKNIAAFSQRIPDEVIAKAKQLAKIKGEPMTDATSVQGLHWIKMALDDLTGAADRAGNATLKSAYTGLKNDLLTGLDNLSPDYQAARKTYQAMSRPVNQMDTVAEIAAKSVDKLDGNIKPRALANALTDPTAARATGFSGATLENTFDPAQLNRLNFVLDDVRRATDATRAGKGIGSDTVQKLAYTNMLDQVGVPTFLRDMRAPQVAGNLLSRGADAIYGRANREIADQLAQVMLDPALAAQAMDMARRGVPPGVITQLLSNPATAQLTYQAAPVAISAR
jgi:hypothetical protein